MPTSEPRLLASSRSATWWKGSIRSALQPDKQRSLRPQFITCCATATADCHPPSPGSVPLGAYRRRSASHWRCNERKPPTQRRSPARLSSSFRAIRLHTTIGDTAFLRFDDPAPRSRGSRASASRQCAITSAGGLLDTPERPSGGRDRRRHPTLCSKGLWA